MFTSGKLPEITGLRMCLTSMQITLPSKSQSCRGSLIKQLTVSVWTKGSRAAKRCFNRLSICCSLSTTSVNWQMYLASQLGNHCSSVKENCLPSTQYSAILGCSSCRSWCSILIARMIISSSNLSFHIKHFKMFLLKQTFIQVWSLFKITYLKPYPPVKEMTK